MESLIIKIILILSTRFACFQSLPASREDGAAFSIPLFITPFFFPPSSRRHSASPLVLITAPQRVCYCLCSIGLRKVSSRERDAACIFPLLGPTKADCGKIRLGKRPAHRRLGRTCSLLACQYNPGQIGDY